MGRTLANQGGRSIAHPLHNELAEALQRLAHEAGRVMDFEDCSVALYDPASDDLITVASSNPALGTSYGRFRMGQGIAGHVAASREAILLTEATEDPRFFQLPSRQIRSVLCVPILGSEEVLLGVITVVSVRPAAFGEHHRRLLEMFANTARVSIAQTVRAEQLRVLNELGRGLLGSSTLDDMFQLVQWALTSLLPLDFLHLYQDEVPPGGILQWASPVVVAGLDGVTLEPGTLTDLQVLSADRLRDLIGVDPTQGACEQYICLPLHASGASSGYILAGSKRAGAVSTELLDTLHTVASQTALWIRNQGLHQRERTQTDRLEAVFRNSSDAIIMLADGAI
ncbi:MAG: GAF domain-containing protein, partial [Chloroflexota bacterium]|nr:GAF domain-containing protein [Chloroflexota bacterium]